MGLAPRRKAAKSSVRQAVDQSRDPILDSTGAKVDEEPEAKLGQLDVGEDLFLVHRGGLFDGFQLDDDKLSNEKVGAKAHIEAKVIVLDGDGYLAPHAESSPFQLVRQDCLVN